MTLEIGGYEIKYVMLGLASYVRIIPKKSWDFMGIPKLVWSPLQLRLAN